MKSVFRLVVAFLTGVSLVGCGGGSPTSPTPVTVTPPVTTPVPTGPVQIALIREFSLDPFIPNVANGGVGTRFRKTVGDIEFRVEFPDADDYNFIVVVQNHNTGDGITPIVALSVTPLSFHGKSGSVSVSYDNSKCFQGECFVYISNRSNKPVNRDKDNVAMVFGTPEP